MHDRVPQQAHELRGVAVHRAVADVEACPEALRARDERGQVRRGPVDAGVVRTAVLDGDRHAELRAALGELRERLAREARELVGETVIAQIARVRDQDGRADVARDLDRREVLPQRFAPDAGVDRGEAGVAERPVHRDAGEVRERFPQALAHIRGRFIWMRVWWSPHTSNARNPCRFANSIASSSGRWRSIELETPSVADTLEGYRP